MSHTPQLPFKATSATYLVSAAEAATPAAKRLAPPEPAAGVCRRRTKRAPPAEAALLRRCVEAPAALCPEAAGRVPIVSPAETTRCVPVAAAERGPPATVAAEPEPRHGRPALPRRTLPSGVESSRKTSRQKK